MVTLDQLRVLMAIRETGSFSAAGRSLRRATSAVSYAIKSLEDELGLVLFDRSGHRASLTASGLRMVEEAQGILSEVDALLVLAEQLRGGWESRMQVVVDGGLPLAPVMRALRRFSETHSPTRTELRVEYLNGVRESFARDNADLMLVFDYVGDKGHVAHPLPPVELVLLCHPKHPVLSGSVVNRAHLARFVELIVEDSARTIPRRTGRLSLGSPHVLRSSDFSSKRQALLEGVGFGWMPMHLVSDDMLQGRLVSVPFEEGSTFLLTPHMVHRRTPVLGPAVKRFIALLEEEQGAS